jgi:hypothetical protein
MSSFYHPPNDPRLLLYSERGLMSHLLLSLLATDLGLVLDAATNANGARLREAIGNPGQFRLLTEFDLGKAGFGCPDGGILIDPDGPEPCFVFVEAKLGTFDSEFIAPQTSAWVHHQGQQAGGWERVRKKIGGFNSSSNGQLELRWRFVTALRLAGTAGTVREQPPVCLSPELMANDVFYLRSRMAPNPLVADHWRSVDLTPLEPLHRMLLTVKRFVLLSITGDRVTPQRLSDVRLFDEHGQPVARPRDHLYWMPMEAVERRLTRL